MTITGNVKYIPAGVTQYVIDGNDGEINVDTSANAVTLILPNIINSGYANTDKGFVINDFSGNAATNNITIVASNNTVNSQSSIIISANGGTAKCSIASMNEWFIITEPLVASSYTASNGISLVGNDFRLTSQNISQFINDSGYLTSSAGTNELSPVISRTNNPPVLPNLGDRYLINTVPTGIWVGNANNIAEWDGLSWVYTSSALNDIVYITDVLSTLRYNGTIWVTWAGTAIIQNGNTISTPLVVGTNTAQSLIFKTNNVESARVLSNGNWGLGTIIPTAKLQVKGIDATSANYALKVDNSSSNSLFSVRNDGFVTINNSVTWGKISTFDYLWIAQPSNLSTNYSMAYNSGYLIFNSTSTLPILIRRSNVDGTGLSPMLDFGRSAIPNIIKLNDMYGVGISSYKLLLNTDNLGAVQIGIFNGTTVQGNFIFDNQRISVGFGTITPATSALLDLTSTTGALLVPRMTTSEKNALTATNGMILYDLTLNKFQGYEAGAWTNLI